MSFTLFEKSKSLISFALYGFKSLKVILEIGVFCYKLFYRQCIIIIIIIILFDNLRCPG